MPLGMNAYVLGVLVKSSRNRRSCSRAHFAVRAHMRFLSGYRIFIDQIEGSYAGVKALTWLS